MPPDQDPVLRKPRSKSVEPLDDKSHNEKEMLRKRLQEKEAEQRKQGGDKGKPAPGKTAKEQSNARVRPQSAPPRHGIDEHKHTGIKPQPRLGKAVNKRDTPTRPPKVPPKPLPKPQVKTGS